MEQSSLPRIESIRFENLWFGHEGHDFILKQCDFEFPSNQIVWVKSPEGSGKSTLLQILAGLTLPTSGLYWMNEKNVTEMSFEEFLPYRLRIGYSFDYGGLLANRTIFDNLALPMLYHSLVPADIAKAHVQELIERFGLEKQATKRPADVPGRVRKLAILLRSLVLKPDLLLMDDPSVGLGQETVNALTQYLLELRDEGYLKHMFISSYDDKFMAELPHRLIHLDEGILFLEAETEEKKVVAA